MVSNEENMQVDVVAIELPAPSGWIKKFTPKKGRGRTPSKNGIVFISPTGEEVRHKRQLEQYLKFHPGGPAMSEFEWGVGESPRRSARLSNKSKAMEALESGLPVKKQKSSLKKGKRESNTAEEHDEGASAEETNDYLDIAVDASGEEAIIDEPPQVPEVMEKKIGAKRKKKKSSLKGKREKNSENEHDEGANAEETKDSVDIVVDEEVINEVPHVMEVKTEGDKTVDDPQTLEISGHSGTEIADATAVESTEGECHPEKGTPVDKVDVPEENVCHFEKETPPTDKVDEAEASALNQDTSDEKRAAGLNVQSSPDN